MSSLATLNFTLGNQLVPNSLEMNKGSFNLYIPIKCPFCDSNSDNVGSWGTYEACSELRSRFRCYNCSKTFNISKIPYWDDKFSDVILKLSQLLIEDQISVNGLSQQWNIPRSTLQTLLTDIKELLSTNFELIKQVHNMLNKEDIIPKSDLRIIFYDEGFLKLQGMTAFLIFTLDRK